MAIAVTQRPLSGSVDALPIQVSATQGSATVLHTGQNLTSIWERVFAFAINSSTNTVSVTIEVGPSTNQIFEEIPARANNYCILNGLFLLGRSAGLSATVIKIGASVSALIQIFGYVDRMTET